MATPTQPNATCDPLGSSKTARLTGSLFLASWQGAVEVAGLPF